jgi:hypothetical protein
MPLQDLYTGIIVTLMLVAGIGLGILKIPGHSNANCRGS